MRNASVILIVLVASLGAGPSASLKYKVSGGKVVTILNPLSEKEQLRVRVVVADTNESIVLHDERGKPYLLSEGTGDGRVDFMGERFKFLMPTGKGVRFEVEFFRPNAERATNIPLRYLIDTRTP